MKKWYHEDWRFEIEVLRVGQENRATECRLGLEPGDTFECQYETPAGFCPTSFFKIFPALEVVRCGGDLRNLGGQGPCQSHDPRTYRLHGTSTNVNSALSSYLDQYSPVSDSRTSCPHQSRCSDKSSDISQNHADKHHQNLLDKRLQFFHRQVDLLPEQDQ
jgi:uncharacterized repeat protein (TIGR04076 family)